jgi:hypothetical protein
MQGDRTRLDVETESPRKHTETFGIRDVVLTILWILVLRMKAPPGDAGTVTHRHGR